MGQRRNTQRVTPLRRVVILELLSDARLCERLREDPDRIVALAANLVYGPAALGVGAGVALAGAMLTPSVPLRSAIKSRWLRKLAAGVALGGALMSPVGEATGHVLEEVSKATVTTTDTELVETRPHNVFDAARIDRLAMEDLIRTGVGLHSRSPGSFAFDFEGSHHFGEEPHIDPPEFILAGLDELRVEPERAMIRSGETVQFKAFAITRDGLWLLVSHSARWQSENLEVALVDSVGAATGLMPGSSRTAENATLDASLVSGASGGERTAPTYDA